MTLKEILLEEAKIEGILESTEKIISQLILKYNFSNADIMNVSNAPLHYVQKVRRRLNYRSRKKVLQKN